VRHVGHLPRLYFMVIYGRQIRTLRQLLFLGNSWKLCNFNSHQKGAHYAGTKTFNHVATHIKCVANEIQAFKETLKIFLLDSSLYYTDKYFNSNK
jgi:hypothetical protein